ncbi:hypothetical protein FE784_09215 [Paenibacillus hemerocallicola]|uniref:Uncharacterized protein n=1 Tax=Paenibacillus hemerocallicola TaxID=1172614 RepID=A0A5C4TCV8_9BACL|nr:hypothetical protein [Paenibacillus hemerocallicola]TNJ66735.1 hypothetical protein FE784_09215 [Paenibacillus hemerocallicola]
MTYVWGLVLLVFVPVMAGLMIAFSWLSHAAVRRMIGRKHQALEEIHLTNRIPASWTEKYDRKLRSLARSGSGSEGAEAAKWSRRKREKIVSELDRLIEYTRRTKLVAEEEVRGALLDDLEMLRSEWRMRGQGG